MQVQRCKRTAEMQRCRGAEEQRNSGTEQVQMWCRCSDQMCQAEGQWCRFADLQLSRSAEVQIMCRGAIGADMEVLKLC